MTKLRFETRASPVHMRYTTLLKQNPQPGSEDFIDRQREIFPTSSSTDFKWMCSTMHRNGGWIVGATEMMRTSYPWGQTFPVNRIHGAWSCHCCLTRTGRTLPICTAITLKFHKHVFMFTGLVQITFYVCLL